MAKTPEELLHQGRSLLNHSDWVAMNNQEIATKLGIHHDDFLRLFKNKWNFESGVLEDYANQHLLYAKTKLSCWFQKSERKLKRYNLYLINEFISYPYTLNLIFSSLHAQEVTCHSIVSKNFVQQLAAMFAKCLEEPSPRTDNLKKGLNQSIQSLRDFTEKLIPMGREKLADKYLEIKNT